MLERALELARAGRAQAEKDFLEELGIASVGTLERHAADTRRNAGWLLERLRAMGMEADLYEHGGGFPTVRAQWLGRPGAPTVCLYGHYDVQPPDPLELWTSPPFEPRLQDGYVIARGACDNKGMHLACVKAAEYALAAGGPPVNLRLLIEGEEEGGGEVLPHLLESEGDQAAGDFNLIVDGTLLQLLIGLRGLLYTEIEVRGPAQDLHSGAFGGNAPNPFNTLAHVLAGLKDRDGHILIPGFYDGVRGPSDEERASWRELPIGEDLVQAVVGAPALEGEPEYGMWERAFVRPTLDVHGIRGGFTEEGTKTVIPAVATAKVSMRLVPDQTPERILEALDRHAQALATPGTRVTVRRLGTPSQPILIDHRHAGTEAAARAFEASFGRRPDLVRAGYSIPVVADFARFTTGRLVITGFSGEDDGAHAPNERMSLESFHRGAEMILHTLWNLAPRG